MALPHEETNTSLPGHFFFSSGGRVQLVQHRVPTFCVHAKPRFHQGAAAAAPARRKFCRALVPPEFSCTLFFRPPATFPCNVPATEKKVFPHYAANGSAKHQMPQDDPQHWFTARAIGPTMDVVLRCTWCDQGTQRISYTHYFYLPVRYCSCSHYSVKRDLLQCQKRPTTVSKETYYSHLTRSLAARSLSKAHTCT